MTERQLQNAVVELARLLGYRVYHTFDSRRSEAGFPDLVLLRPPRLLFVELKTEKGKVSAAQQEWADDIATTGTGYFLWRPSDWASGHIERVLKGEA